MSQGVFAIFLALVGAFLLAFGVLVQSRAVKNLSSAATKQGSSLRVKIRRLIVTPAWLGGGFVLVVGVVCNVSALALAPLTVVQPLGAIALVITTVLNARVQKYSLDHKSWIAIMLCLVGSVAFVLLAINVTHESPRIDQEREKVLLIIMAAVNLVCLLVAILFRKTRNAFHYIIGAGVLFGFIAVLTRVTLIDFLESSGNIFGMQGYGLLALIGLVVTVAVGLWFVQHAYANSPPELVIAGLTVIDPIVGVFVGIALLGELKDDVALPITIIMILAALVAIGGVAVLSRYHPEIRQRLRCQKMNFEKPGECP